jgi:hypothetical protein
VTPARAQPQSPGDARINSGILADALEELGREDRDTIRSLLPGDAVGIDAAFRGAYDRAVKLQQQCTRESWPWQYKGRQLFPSEHMDKVLQLLDRFKSAGDVAANVDPVHIGLPWAGIRVILEVCEILGYGVSGSTLTTFFARSHWPITISGPP